MVRALIEAGADLEATGFAVPDGTALAHAVEFGNVEVVDVLAEAGAVIHNLIEAAGVGSLEGNDLANMPLDLRARAARAAAVCERLEVLDLLIPPTGANPDRSHGCSNSERIRIVATTSTSQRRSDGAASVSVRSPDSAYTSPLDTDTLSGSSRR
jgi:hypothetical protein